MLKNTRFSLLAFGLVTALAIGNTPVQAQSALKKCQELAGTSREMTLNFEGTTINRQIQFTADKARAVLDKFIPLTTPGLPPQLTDRIRLDTVLQNPNLFDRMYSSRGMLFWIGLKAARDDMLVDGQITNPIWIDPLGKISDYSVANDMSGFIENVMCFDIYAQTDANTRKHVRTHAMKIRTKVMKCGFRIIARQTTTDDNAPIFPGSIIPLTNMSNINPTFTYKLQATPLLRSAVDYNGDPCVTSNKVFMEIETIWYDLDAQSNTSNAFDWTEIPKGSAEFGMFYTTTAESCIDMLFPGKPPQTLDPSQDPPYCLGRCRNPFMINTGL